MPRLIRFDPTCYSYHDWRPGPLDAMRKAARRLRPRVGHASRPLPSGAR
jgi:hypothetical protein